MTCSCATLERGDSDRMPADYFTDASRDKDAEVYAADLEAFGYQF